MADLPAAREACVKGLELEPDNSQVKEELRRVEIAESLALKDSATDAFKAQDYEKAVEDLTAAIALDPSNQVFFSNRSVAYTAMQMYEKALEDADGCSRHGQRAIRGARLPSSTLATCRLRSSRTRRR